MAGAMALLADQSIQAQQVPDEPGLRPQGAAAEPAPAPASQPAEPESVTAAVPKTEALLAQLQTGSDEQRRGAALALAGGGDRRAVPALFTCMQTDAQEAVRAACARALGRFTDRRTARGLRHASLHDPSEQVRQAARRALSSHAWPRPPLPPPTARTPQQARAMEASAESEPEREKREAYARRLKLGGILLLAIGGAVGLGLAGAGIGLWHEPECESYLEFDTTTIYESGGSTCQMLVGTGLTVAGVSIISGGVMAFVGAQKSRPRQGSALQAAVPVASVAIGRSTAGLGLRWDF